MTTNLLYHQNDYMKSFEATIQTIEPEPGYVILDATAFFPTGGHQWCDNGKIMKSRKEYFVIVDVQKDDAGVVRHCYEATTGNIQPGDKIRGEIHWPRRFQHMKLHTAQHIFSRRALDRFGIKTGRADFSPDGGLAVMETALSWEQILLLEHEVNQTISQGLAVERSIDDKGIITISIKDLDNNYCGGTHVRATSEIEFFKITRVHKSNIYYQVGERAKFQAARLANNALETASKLQMEDPMALTSRVTELISQRDEALNKLVAWEEETTRRQIKTAIHDPVRMNGTAHVFKLDLPHRSLKDVKKLLRTQLLDDNQVWICMTERRNLMISSRTDSINADHVLQHFVDEWGMRGGGNPGFAQGGPVPEVVSDPPAKIAEWLLSRNGKHKD